MRFSHSAFVALALLAGLNTGLAQNSRPSFPDGPVTFEQYRAYRLDRLHQAEAKVATRLADTSLDEAKRQRLEHRKAAMERFAALTPADQDARLRKRFDAIDADHDGTITKAEIEAFRAAHP
ncbi:MAG TPA: hypothetical protein VKT70_12115, partial [Stellaceae bacterium]|nr:hypothetical protein [Stellaceae bacterium]